MDKLQWFKFTPSDWIMGKIQRCPEITQARFMRLCCVYWNKDCNMTYEDAEVEIDKEHLDILISKRVLKNSNGIITIAFLLEQIKEIEVDKVDKSQSGQIGNLKRWHRHLYDKFINNQLTLNQAIEQSKLSHPDGTPMAPQSQNIAEESREELEKKRKEEEKKRGRKENNFPYQEIIEIFNSVCINLPKVEKITSTRKTSIKKIVEENSLQTLGDVFKEVSESHFLNGGGPTGWKANFDWILIPKNFLKILEGNYKNNNNGSTKSNEQIFTEAMGSEVAKNFRFK